MKYTPTRYKQAASDLKQHKYTIRRLKETIRLLEEGKVTEKAALLKSEIKQLREANEFNLDEIARLKSEIKLPWFLASLLFSLLIWSLLLCWSLLL